MITPFCQLGSGTKGPLLAPASIQNKEEKRYVASLSPSAATFQKPELSRFRFLRLLILPQKTGRSPPQKKEPGGSHPAALSIASASPSRFRSRPSSRVSRIARASVARLLHGCAPHALQQLWQLRAQALHQRLAPPRLQPSRAEPSRAEASCFRGRFGGVSSTLGPCGGVSKQGGAFFEMALKGSQEETICLSTWRGAPMSPFSWPKLGSGSNSSLLELVILSRLKKGSVWEIWTKSTAQVAVARRKLRSWYLLFGW